jgi:hypothetical protein
MLDEAAQAGLLLNKDSVDLILGRRGQGYAQPDPNAILHNSLTNWWLPVEFIPKPHWDQTSGQIELRANHSRQRTWPEKPECMTLLGSVMAETMPNAYPKTPCG